MNHGTLRTGPITDAHCWKAFTKHAKVEVLDILVIQLTVSKHCCGTNTEIN